MIGSLGFCRHCGELLIYEDIVELDNRFNVPVLRCPQCCEIVGPEDFGYEKVEPNIFEKKRWVGLGYKWISAQPTENFDLGDLRVITNINSQEID